MTTLGALVAFVMRLAATGGLVAYMDRMLPATSGEELSMRWPLASAIAMVTDDHERRQLARLARFESTFRLDVATCVVHGRAGEVTAWQLLPRPNESAAELCSSLERGAAVALARVRESVEACRSYPAAERLAVYARGRCSSADGRRLSRVRYAP